MARVGVGGPPVAQLCHVGFHYWPCPQGIAPSFNHWVESHPFIILDPVGPKATNEHRRYFWSEGVPYVVGLFITNSIVHVGFRWLLLPLL